MTAVFEPVRTARLAWMRQQDQLFIEVDDLAKFEEPVRVAIASPAHPAAAETTGSSEHNTNGTRRSTCPGSAAGASQEQG